VRRPASGVNKEGGNDSREVAERRCRSAPALVVSFSNHHHTPAELLERGLMKFVARSVAVEFGEPVFAHGHYSRRFVGVVQFLQPGCRCQKQPWTKMAVLYFGRRTSAETARAPEIKAKRWLRATFNRNPHVQSEAMAHAVQQRADDLFRRRAWPPMRDMFHERHSLFKRSLLTHGSLHWIARREHRGGMTQRDLDDRSRLTSRRSGNAGPVVCILTARRRAE
jgi:hypothetical protein